jgi:hypothetical protein
MAINFYWTDMGFGETTTNSLSSDHSPEAAAVLLPADAAPNITADQISTLKEESKPDDTSPPNLPSEAAAVPNITADQISTLKEVSKSDDTPPPNLPSEAAAAPNITADLSSALKEIRRCNLLLQEAADDYPVRYELHLTQEIDVILEEYKHFESFVGFDPCNRKSQPSNYVRMNAECYRYKFLEKDYFHKSYLLVWYINDHQAYLEYMTENKLEDLQSSNILDLRTVFDPVREELPETKEMCQLNNSINDNLILKLPEPRSMTFNLYDTEIIMIISEEYNCRYKFEYVALGIHPNHRNDDSTKHLRTK